MKREKLYKFNMQKYGHNIEYAYNIARNKVDSDSATDQDWENYEHICHVYQHILCNSVIYLIKSGKKPQRFQYGQTYKEEDFRHGKENIIF